MPAPKADRIQLLLTSLNNAYPKRVALRTSEIAAWMSDTWGVKNSPEVCRRRLAAVQADAAPKSKLTRSRGKRLYSVIDLAHDLADYLDTLPSTVPPPPLSFREAKGKGKGWRSGARLQIQSRGWSIAIDDGDLWILPPFEVDHGNDQSFPRLENRQLMKQIESRRVEQDEIWQDIESQIIAHGRLKLLEAMPSSGPSRKRS